RLDAPAQVEAITTMTHLANADAADDASVDAALAAFDAATRDLPGDRSVANSAATLRFGARVAAGVAAWVRPGIMLYGSSPDAPLHGIDDWKLAPAMSLRTLLIAVQELAAGASVGYGSSFPAPPPPRAAAVAAGALPATHRMRSGIAACGYADGYPRLAPGSNERGTPVLVD